MIGEWRQRAVEVLFVVTETVAWFFALRVLATAFEQSFLTVIRERLEIGLNSFDPVKAASARELIVQLQQAATVGHGPSFPVVLATAAGGFLLMRLLVRYHFEGTLGAVTFLAGSVLALNVLLHIAVSGDLRVWDVSGLVGYVSDPQQSFVGQLDLDRFLREHDLSRPHGMALGAVSVGLVAAWLRFAAVGRAPLTFDRVLRSFSVGFGIVLCCVLGARFEGQSGLAIWAVPHFILGVLSLAVANNARTLVPIEGERRTGPWVAAVAGTIAILAIVAATLGLLALMQAGRLLNLIGTLATEVLFFLLVVVMTPIFWLIGVIVRLIVPADFADRFAAIKLNDVSPVTRGTQEATNTGPPLWLQAGLKFLAVVIIAWVIWQIVKLIMRRRRPDAAPVDEVRGRVSGTGGFGDLLRGLLPRAARSPGVDWMRGQPIYRLYGRAVVEAERRGFRYLPGQTPREFSERASRWMDAPYEPIGDAFDRARYGRHFPAADEVRALESDLARWEAATPATEELRERLAGATPLSEEDETTLTISRIRQATQRLRRTARAGAGPGGSFREGPGGPYDGPGGPQLL